MDLRTKSIVAISCGVGSLALVVFSFLDFGILGFLTLPAAIVGVVFGVMARKEGAQGQDRNFATAGLVCGIISLALYAVSILITCCAAIALGGLFFSNL